MLSYPSRFAAGLLGAVVIASACSGSPTATSPAPTDQSTPAAADFLTILEPPNGATVDSETVIVRGTAPSRTRVVRDVRLSRDDNTVSDANGSWAMVVSLDPGPNSLRFRLEDDSASEVDWILILEPAAAVATPIPATQQPTSSPSPSPPPATAPPTSPPTPTPTPLIDDEEDDGDFFEFDDDTWEVGDEIPPGTYRTAWDPSGCYWARLSGFGGQVGDIIANGFGSGYQVVMIGRNDVGFESSGCGLWTSDLSRVTDSMEQFGEGTFIVGTDIRPGEYRSSQGDGCYWARLSGFGGTVRQIIANDFRTSGRARVTIRASDEGFTSSGCGTWTRQ